jgi:hypothetical protein
MSSTVITWIVNGVIVVFVDFGKSKKVPDPPSASRFTAGAFEFLNLSPSRERPEV